jgi:hypothetical protein
MSAQRRSFHGGVFAAQVCALAVIGCASATGVPPLSTSDEQRVRGWSTVLTATDLASAHATTIVEALTRLRPEFLRGSARGPLIGQPEIAVYLNNSLAGEISTLNTIPIGAIREIVFLHPVEAHSRFGPVCPCANGAILIRTRSAWDNSPNDSALR